MQAMILAAGFGTRLLPYTQYRPKPLFPLLNKPLLLLHIDALKRAGFDHIIINCHHLKDQVIDMASSIEGVCLQIEESILGTGGGLRQAIDKLRDEPILVTNADIYHTIDVGSLYNGHLASSAKVTLAVHNFPRFNSMIVEGSKLRGFAASAEGGNLAFTGLHVIDVEILQQISLGRKSCIVQKYKEMVRDDQGVFGLSRVDDAYWTDMGTVEDYLNLHGRLLKGEVPLWHDFRLSEQSPFLVDSGAEIGENVTMLDWCCIGRASIGDNVTIKRSVIWDGAVVPDDSRLENTIVAN